jgi:hypothetical protein
MLRKETRDLKASLAQAQAEAQNPAPPALPPKDFPL